MGSHYSPYEPYIDTLCVFEGDYFVGLLFDNRVHKSNRGPPRNDNRACKYRGLSLVMKP
jgi:hypothetical protein